jgi:anti-anti-sigma factor
VASTLVIAPQENVGSLADERIQPELNALVAQLDATKVQHLVVDFARVDYFGSSMLEALLRLWKHVHAQGGRVAVCNVSSIGRDVLQTGRFDTLWEVFDSREDAIKALDSA